MAERKRIQAFVACQVEGCAEEISYPLDMVRKFDGLPVCEGCYFTQPCETDEDGWPVVDWRDLPPVTMEDLGP